ncbi:hypothetical protein [Rheinheimera sp. MMS21-TC3]|uniref:hypothetical protein n=1 Tax=Rheinheimera sp. MMS21-TC3 TaxID=3072790 RepID=UPI0028C47E0A|nr:hypothetical protein [Rheinheimera sp. MMS21-TC3]WNO60439.1 hypothetical protein RDV63_05595 [Rheinheimera sp. MMS21-TC3]
MIIDTRTWEAITALLESDRQDAIQRLIHSDSDQARGVIKFIDEILERYPFELKSKPD